MCTRNIHSYKPQGFCGYVLLGTGYLPCLFAVALIAANVFPYHYVFLPVLYEACALGNAWWVYYYYCVAMMVFAEVMVYGNFLFTILTCPGYVPHEPWAKPPVYDGKSFSDNPYEVRQLDRDGRMRYCAKCEQFKPDNAYHCRLCNHCVYRMDHHCPWVNNCVGRENGKFFLLFTAYIPVGAFHIVLTQTYSIFMNLQHKNLTLDVGGDYLTFMIMCLSILFSTAMGFAFAAFAAHFLYMSYSGQTSVSKKIASMTMGMQNAAAAAAERTRLNARMKEEHLYDLFGSDRRWWRIILPFKPIRGRKDMGYYPQVVVSRLNALNTTGVIMSSGSGDTMNSTDRGGALDGLV